MIRVVSSSFAPRPHYEVRGGERALVLPREKYRSLFPLASRRRLPVFLVGEDGPNYIFASPLPEQRGWRITKISKIYVFSSPRMLAAVVPPASRRR